MQLEQDVEALFAAGEASNKLEPSLQRLHRILSSDIVAREMSALELDAQMRSFFVENPIDNLGTATAMVSYGMAMNIILNDKSATLATHALFNTVTNIGLMASFLCGLSFTSSAIDQVNEVSRAHLRTKNEIYHMQFMHLLLRSMLCDLGATEKIDYLIRIAQSELRVLEECKGSSELLLHSSSVRRHAPEEIARIQEEIALYRRKIAQGKEQLAALQALKKNIPTSNTPEMNHADKEKLKHEVEAQRKKIIDILKRPRYNASVDYSDVHETENDQSYASMASTSLYAKRRALIAKLAVYRQLVRNFDATNITDASLMQDLYTDHPEIQQEAALYFTGLQEDFCRVRLQHIPQDKNRIKATCLRLLEDYHHLQAQINYYVGYCEGLASISNKLDSAITILPQAPPLQPAGNTAPPKKRRIAFLKPIDTRTTALWRNEGREIALFFQTLRVGIGAGVEKLLENHDNITDIFGIINKWIKRGIRAVKNVPVLWHLLAFIYVICSIPSMLYHAFSNFSDLLRNLKYVVDTLHKSVRDVDQALRYHPDDQPVLRPFKWVVQMAWMAVTLPFEIAGGMLYFFLSLLRSDGKVSDIAYAITPPTWAAWIHEKSKTAGSFGISGLYLLTFIGGIVNTCWSPIKRLFSIFEIRRNPDAIQSSRDNVWAAWTLFTSKVSNAWYTLIEQPVVSAWTQVQEENERTSAKWPFRSHPFRWIAKNVFKTPIKFIISVFLNVFIRTAYVSVKTLAQSAPVITASVITVSTLMTGIPFPVNLLLTLEFGRSTQLWFAMAVTCGDATNGTHDAYNLANSILRNQQNERAEKRAVEAMKGCREDQKFSRLRTFFERVEEGKALAEKNLQVNLDKEQADYKKAHLTTMRAVIENKNLIINAELVKTLLSRHLAYFLVNTAKYKTQAQYEAFFGAFMQNKNIEDMAAKIYTQMNEVHQSIVSKENLHYLLSTTTLVGFDYAKQLNNLRYQSYREDAIYLYINGTERGNRIKFVRNPENPAEYMAKKPGYENVRATKISFFDWVKSWFVADPSIVNGFKISGLTSNAPAIASAEPLVQSQNVIKVDVRRTTSLYLVYKNSDHAPIRAERISTGFVDGDVFELQLNGQTITVREKGMFENLAGKIVIGKYVVEGTLPDGFKADDYSLQWLNPTDKVNIDKATAQLSTQVTQETPSLCMMRGYKPLRPVVESRSPRSPEMK